MDPPATSSAPHAWRRLRSPHEVCRRGTRRRTLGQRLKRWWHTPVAYLLNPANLMSVSQCQDAQRVAPALSLAVEAFEVRGPDELDRAFTAITERAEALIVGADAFFAPYRTRIVEFAATHRLPAMYQLRSYVGFQEQAPENVR
jgi:hypothetical protein